MYFHETDNWPNFRWDSDKIVPLLETVGRKQGLLYGRLNAIGFCDKLNAMLVNFTNEVVFSSEIEGIMLNIEQVRSSIAWRLGIENIKYTAPSRYVDSIVNVMLSALKNYEKPLSKQSLCEWHLAFFPDGHSNGLPIAAGRFRTEDEYIVSGTFGREKIHYIAPSPDRIEREMKLFVDWFDVVGEQSYILRSAIAHLWFVSIHPFEDGNGRMARLLSELLLARGDKSELRFYNISSQINKDKKRYYEILERVQRGDGDITEWLEWYLRKIMEALDEGESLISNVLNKSFFWQRVGSTQLSQRQTSVLNQFLDGYEAKITSKSWAMLGKCSKDTAIRDIQDLVFKNILVEEIPGAKRPSYSIVMGSEEGLSGFSKLRLWKKEKIIISLQCIREGALLGSGC